MQLESMTIELLILGDNTEQRMEQMRTRNYQMVKKREHLDKEFLFTIITLGKKHLDMKILNWKKLGLICLVL